MAALVAVSLGWMTGLVLGRFVALAAGAATCFSALAVFALGLAVATSPSTALARWDIDRRVVAGGLAGLLALAALAAGVVAGRPEPPRSPPYPGLTRLLARVERSVPGPGRDTAVVVSVLRGDRVEDGRSMAPGTRLFVSGTSAPRGAIVELLGKVTPWVPFRNPSPHPPWPEGRPIDGAARLPDGASARMLDADAVSSALESARTTVRHRLLETLSPRVAAVARTLVLGEGRSVDPRDRDAVRAAGLAHVFAVSGLHVTLVAGAFVALVRRTLLAWPRVARRFVAGRIAALAGIPCAFAYAAFAGGAPSAWRAAVTAGLAWALVAGGRVPSAIAVASAAALVLGALMPTDAASPSFLLSIVATLAIVRGVDPRDDRDAQAIVAPWREGLRAVVRTTLATAPLVLWSFGSFPLLALVGNVLLVPLAAFALLPLSLAHAALATLLPFVAPATAVPLERVAAAFLGGAGALAWDAGPLMPPPSVAQGLCLAALSLALLTLRDPRKQAIACAVASLALVALELELRHREPPAGRLRATFLDVGQGDGALIDLPDGRLLAVDFGGAVLHGPDPGAEVIAPLLAARRRERVDVAVLTHPHPDHYGGLAALLDAVRVGELWVSRQASVEARDGPAAALVRAAEARGTQVVHPDALCGRPRRFGDATVEVIAPCPRYDAGLDENDNSLVLRLTFGQRSVLLTGDAERAREASLAGGVGHADVLKVGHHGSDTSTTDAFVRAVAPRLAVVSAGLRNRYGHPSSRVLARLRRAGATVLRTDQMGGAIVETDGRTLRWRTWAAPRWQSEERAPPPTATKPPPVGRERGRGAAPRRGTETRSGWLTWWPGPSRTRDRSCSASRPSP